MERELSSFINFVSSVRQSVFCFIVPKEKIPNFFKNIPLTDVNFTRILLDKAKKTASFLILTLQKQIKSFL